MKTVLIYNRPFVSRFMAQYDAEFGDRYDLPTISDFKFRDDVGLVTRQYRHLNRSDILRDRGLDYAVIARRCRYLRTLATELQRRLINSAWAAIEEVFALYKPDAHIGLPMDCYYIDLLDQYCVANGIVTVNPVQSFLPDRTRMTRRGEPIEVRTVSDEEVAEYRQILLGKNFRPTWLSRHRTRAKLIRMYGREVAKLIFFAGAKLLKRDRYSFHYNCVYPIGPSINTRSIDVLRSHQHFTRDLAEVQRRASRFSRAVFLPLQFSPESSLDYNIADSRFSDYDQLLNAVLENLPDDTLLIAKEHPDMYGYRHTSLYERFLGRDNVLLVDVAFTVQQLFDICEYVLVTGGASTGAEALVKGRTVISLGGAFYEGDGTAHSIRDFDDVARWSERLVPIRNNSTAIDGVIRRILSSTVAGPYDFVRISRDKIPMARANVRTIMEWVQREASESRLSAGAGAR